MTELFERCLSAASGQRESTLEELCADHPQHAGRLRAMYARLLEVDMLPREHGVHHGPLAIAPGTQIGGCIVESVLGHGGMGVVLRARQPALGDRAVALKVVRPELVHDARARLRFQREAELAARIDHPNICKILDVGQHGDYPFLVMPLVEGDPLDRLIARARETAPAGAPPSDPFGTPGRRWLRAVEVVERLARALDVAHRTGLVHRDIKPGNVMLRADGEPMLLDFGLARDAESPADLTLSRDLLGTPAYMAPEQAAGRPADARTDVHALGVLLFECLTLRLPREAERRDELLRALIHDPPADARRYARDLPADLCSVLAVALDPDPQRRYATAGGLADDLRHVACGEPILARPAGLARRARHWLYRNRIAATIAALLAAGGGGTSIGYVQATGRADRIHRQKDEIGAQKSAIEQRKLEFDQLANIVRLKTAQEREASLHPAWPERLTAIEDWLATDAARLRDALPQLEATLAALRRRARPMTDAEIEAARHKHPAFADLEHQKAKLASRRRARNTSLATAAGRQLELPVLPALPREFESANARLLIAFARMQVGGAQVEPAHYGSELLGLVAAQRALAGIEAGNDDSAARCQALDALAWSWLALGRVDEALAAARRAYQDAPAVERPAYKARGQRIRAAIRSLPGEAGASEIAAIEASVAELLQTTRPEPAFEFSGDAGAEQFLFEKLGALIAEIRAFVRTSVAEVERRRIWASKIGELTHAHPRANVTWAEARAAIAKADGVVASALYREPAIDLVPQIGLVPIGMNPATKLWEFYHLRSGWDGSADPARLAIPRHDARGHVTVGEDTGLVFVLLPGGTFVMGAQKDDPNGANYDPDATSWEGPPHRINLAPFFLSRHEMTQGQWLRLASGNVARLPSDHRPGYRVVDEVTTLAHPVTHVSWTMSNDLLTRVGLVLPTEAQWEYGCRAGTTTPWFCGDTVSSLRGYANLLDDSAKSVAVMFPELRNELSGQDDTLDWNDGYLAHAPVDTMGANGWGLHHVLGNVNEWVRDQLIAYGGVVRAGDGLRLWKHSRSPSYVIRGGLYALGWRCARSAARDDSIAGTRDKTGLRPARPLADGGR